MSELRVRKLEEADAETSQILGFEAFGQPKAPQTEPAVLAMPGRQFWGSFDGDRLAARLAVRDYHSWIGGEQVRTAGIAGVTVALEYRGRGALTPLIRAALEDARGQGSVISTLFPSAPGIYRRFGYELVSDYRTIRLPTEQLGRVAPASTEVRLRRATADDVGDIERIYTTWARAQNGPLTRGGPSFPAGAADAVETFDGVTLAIDAAGEVVGFASWDRGHGYGPTATLEVSDLLALTADGYRALLRGLGTYATITGHTKFDTSGDDVARLFLLGLTWETTDSDPYMLSVLDVAGAVTARRFAAALEVELTFAVTGHFVSGVDGGYRLRVRDGAATCERAPDASGPVLQARGLALLYAGVQSCANLRFAGLLDGGTATDDEALDAAFGGRQFHIRDYF